MQDYCLISTERDVIADAFEIFINHAIKGGQGQFFTPRNIIKMIVEIMNTDENDIIIDAKLPHPIQLHLGASLLKVA